MAEYGVMAFDENGRKKTTYLFSTLERSQKAASKVPGSLVVRLGRNHGKKSFEINKESFQNKESFRAIVDESGNIETPGEMRDRLIEEKTSIVDENIYQLISQQLIEVGYLPGSKPPSYILNSLAMRYNDICPEDFAAAVVKHCELPRISDGGDKNETRSLNPRSPEEKAAWYDTPAGQAWVKEHPVPSIFNLPTPEYIHRRG